jgi:hypothetical protein
VDESVETETAAEAAVSLNLNLSWFYVLSLRAFLALTFSEANLLAFLKGPETVAYDVTEMDKKIWTSLAGDKSITFAFVEPLDGSGELI